MSKLPPNAVPLYRILTKKSRLGFGQYEDLTVGDILKVDEQYIVWCYSHFEKISFCEEILTELGVARRIPKPGTDESLLGEWLRARNQQYTAEERFHGRIKKARLRKNKAIANLIRVRNDVNLTKRQLQAINHGHMKKS